MRYLKIFVILLMTAFLSACGGGTTTSKTKKTSIEIKLAIPDNSKKRTKTSPRFTVGNTSISQVLIGYGLTGDTLTTMDVTTAAENQSSVTISDLEAGKEYSFTVAAFSGVDTLVCQGGDTLTIVPNTVSDLTLTCSFEDKYAIENFVFDIEAKVMSETLSESAMDGYVADESDFGIFNGLDRDAFISNFVETRYAMKSNGLSLVSVQMLNPRIKLPKAKIKTSSKIIEDTATAKVKYIYSDGSYKFEEMWAAKIDGEWKLVGNGHKYDLAIRNQAAQLFSTSGQTTPVKTAGISVGSGTISRDNLSFFTMSGNGINSSGYLVASGLDFIYAKLVTPSSSYFFNEINENMTEYADAAAVQDGDAYNFAITATNFESDTDTLYINGDGITSSYMNGNVFPTAALDNSPECTKSITLTLPTAYSPSWAEVQILAISTQNTGKIIKGRVPLTSPSISIDLSEIIQTAQSYGELKVTAYDASGRAFSTFYSFDNLGLATGTGCASGGGDGGGDGGDSITVDGFFNFYELMDTAQSMSYFLSFRDFKSNTDNSFSAILASDLFTSDIASNEYFEPVLANFGANGEASSAFSIEHANPDSANTMFRVKLLTTSDGSQFIVAGNNDNNDRFVSIMKVNASGDNISWIKKYQSADTDYNEYHKFIDAALVSDSAADDDNIDEIVLLIKGKNSNDPYNATAMLLKVSSEDGSIMNSNLIAATNAEGGVLPFRLGVVKPYDTVVVLAYTCAPDTLNHTTLSLIALNSSLTFQTSREIYEGYEGIMGMISDNNADEYLLNFVDMAVGINGKIYISMVSSSYSDASVAQVSTDFHTGSYNIDSVSFIMLDDADTTYEQYQSRIAVTKTPSETENLIYYYVLASGTMSLGDSQMMVTTPTLAQLSESAFAISGEGLNWVYTLPQLGLDITSIIPGAASSLFLFNGGRLLSINVDGEAGNLLMESADNRLSFHTTTVSPPDQIIMYSTNTISDMNETVIGNSNFNFTNWTFTLTDILAGN